MADIFICYRRDDSPGHAGRLYDRLKAQFGAHRVFMDIDNVAPGVDFVREIERVLQGVGVVLVVIGREWIPAEIWSRSRLESPTDYVRLEIAAALKRRKVKVIPVLVHGASMPPASRLPEELHPLVRRNAVDLRDSAWERDAGKLLDAIGKIVAPKVRAPRKAPRDATRGPARSTPKSPRKRDDDAQRSGGRPRAPQQVGAGRPRTEAATSPPHDGAQAARPARKKRATTQKSGQTPTRKPGMSRPTTEQGAQPARQKKKSPRDGGGQSKPARQKAGAKKTAQQKPTQEKPGLQKPAPKKGATPAKPAGGKSTPRAKSGQPPQPARKGGSTRGGGKSASKRPASSKPSGSGAKRPAGGATRPGTTSNRKPSSPKPGGSARATPGGGGGARHGGAKKPAGGSRNR